MPQDNPRTESQRAENPRAESSRSEHSRGGERIAANMPVQFAEIGAKSVDAGLRMQREIFDTFSDIGRDWFARASSEAELVFKLPNRLTTARSVSDAFFAYQEWLSECFSMFGEDSRRLIADGQKIMDTGARCFANASPAVTS